MMTVTKMVREIFTYFLGESFLFFVKKIKVKPRMESIYSLLKQVKDRATKLYGFL